MCFFSFVVKLSNICGPYWEKAHTVDFKVGTVERDSSPRSVVLPQCRVKCQSRFSGLNCCC